MNPADYELIQRCLAKDANAWDEFVARYSHLIYDAVIRTFERYGYPRQADVLADLHNDVFLLLLEEECRVLKKFEGRNGCQLGHYLRTVTVRRTVDFLRKVRPTVSLDEDAPDAVKGLASLPALRQGPESPGSLIEQDRQESLKRFITRLNPGEREFFQLVIAGEMTPEQMSKNLKISLDYFYVRKKRLIDKLRLMAAQERGGLDGYDG
ncbi:MAG: sigma-70 family RNA polymerase sigma factor [Candidatus Omnitrophica bacterium]|nr:sigma-70 family RNA polymerase sigma factor [Candidatus Omnitrophota bacterium]